MLKMSSTERTVIDVTAEQVADAFRDAGYSIPRGAPQVTIDAHKPEKIRLTWENSGTINLTATLSAEPGP